VAISKNRIEARLQPFLLANLKTEVIDVLMPEDFIEIYNEVAHDLNESAQLRVEHFYKKTSATAAEDSNLTNYLLQGIISKIFSFKFETSAWKEARYTYINDRIVFSEAQDAGIQMDIWYLRKCEEVSAGTDEIDLDNSILPEFLELVKVKVLQDYGGMTDIDYENKLQHYGLKARQKIKIHALSDQGIRRSWFEQTGDDTIYEIVGQWISQDNFTTGLDGNLTYVGD